MELAPQAGGKKKDHWVRRYVRNGSVQKLDWLVVEEITQLDMALWADLACVGLNPDVKFLLLGDFRQLPTVQPPNAKLLVLETGVEIALPESQLQSPQNRAQNMLVWPGLRLIGWEDSQGRLCGRYRGGARARQAGQRAAAEAADAVTYASCQGLTLQGRVRLDLGSVHLSLRHLYVGTSRATSSDLFEVA